MKPDPLHPVSPARYPALRIVLLFSAGIALQSLLPFSAVWWTGSFVLALLLFCSVEWIGMPGLSPARHLLALMLYALLLICAGGARQALELAHRDSRNPQRVIPLGEGDRIHLEGELEEIRRTASGRYQLDLQVDRTRLNDTLSHPHRWRLRAGGDFPEGYADSLRRGSRISLMSTVYPPEGKRNPHDFDYRHFLQRRNIALTGTVDTILQVHPPVGFGWNRLRQRALDLVDHNFSSDTAPLAKALLLGYKNELDRETRQSFSRAGLSHIMAVSGLHVGFILAPFWLVVPFFWSYRFGRWIGLALLVVLLTGYGGLTGFSPSVVRASITGGCLLYGRLFHRIRNSLNLTAVAAFVILMLDPRQLFDVGFQLSFSAVFIILLCLPILHRAVPERIRYRWSGKGVMVILISAAVQIGLFPLLIHYFGEFSVAGPLLNGAAIPLLTLLIPSALLLLGVSTIFPAQGGWLNGGNDLGLRYLARMVDEAAAWEWSWIALPAAEPILIPIWICLILLFAHFRTPALRWKLGAVLLILCCWFPAIRLVQKAVPGTMTVTHFDVGQGDAALIATPGGRHLLIDTGRWDRGYSSGYDILLPHLKREGIDTLDAVILTHPHADHIGGMPDLLEQTAVKTIYHSGYPYDSALHRRWLRMAEGQNIPVRTLRAGDALEVDPAVRLLVYAPLPGPLPANPNDHSLVLELIYGSAEFLFTGDAGRTTELDQIPVWGPLLVTDILKVGHHGSRTASTTPFLRAAAPADAVISVARNSRFGHPHRETVRRIRMQVPRLHFTGLEGAVVWKTDGTEIRQFRWR